MFDFDPKFKTIFFFFLNEKNIELGVESELRPKKVVVNKTGLWYGLD